MPYTVIYDAQDRPIAYGPADNGDGWSHPVPIGGRSATSDVVPDIYVAPADSVTMRQARLALLSVDKLAQVNAAIAAIPDATQRAAAEIEWEYAQTVDRDSPFVQMLGTALALDLDALFTLAAQQ